MGPNVGTVEPASQPVAPQSTGAWRRSLRQAAPTLVLAVILLLTARAEYFKHGYQGLIGFAAIGYTHGERIGVVRGNVGPIGYDGQFAYYLALRPDLIVTCATNTATCPLDDLGELRVERILYPMTARLLAVGQAELLPFVLLLINFIAILVTAALIGQMAVEMGASRWLGAAAGLFTGEVLAFVRDLNDPYAVLWLVLAVYLARKERWIWCALAAAAALLAREQLIFVIPFLALPLIAQRRWRTLTTCAAVALIPFVAWQIALRILYGSWALLSGDTRAAGLAPIPFEGLWQTRTASDFKLNVLTVALPLVIALGIAVLALRRDGVRSLLRDPVPAMVIVYCLIGSLLTTLQWQDVWAPGRLAAPGIVLAVIVSARVPRLPRLGYALLLIVPTVAALFTNVSYLMGAHPHF